MDDETFIKYPKIKILGDRENEGILDGHIIIEEKVDCANFRTMLTKDKFIMGSRGRELRDSGEKQFTRCMVHVRERLNANPDVLKNIYDKYGSIILFGEAIIRHTIGYDFERMPPFLGFDVYVVSKHTFLDREDKVRIFNNIGLEPIKLLYDGLYTDESLLKIPQSVYYNGLAEGVVIKNYEKQMMCKIVDDLFKEKNRETFGGSKKFATDGNEEFIAIYCTNARIEKMIFKMIDDGMELGMPLMGNLFKLVYKDIWEEEWQEIYQSNLSINMKKLRNMVALRCKSVLVQIITNNAINK